MDDWQIKRLDDRLTTLELELSVYARANQEQHRRSVRMHRTARGWLSLIALVLFGALGAWVLAKWLPGWATGIVAFVAGVFATSSIHGDYEKAEGDYVDREFPHWPY